MMHRQVAEVTSVLQVSFLAQSDLSGAENCRQRLRRHYCLTLRNNAVPPPKAVTAIDPTQWSFLRRCLLLCVSVLCTCSSKPFYDKKNYDFHNGSNGI
jgi:hypothetical protein